MRRAGQHRRVDIAFSAAVIVVFLVRFRILVAGGSPPTIDAGDWLAHGDAIFGSDIRSASIVYPPLVPITTKLSTTLFGLTSGISLIGALAAIAPATGLYVTLRMMKLGYQPITPSLLLLGPSSIGESVAWGGIPPTNRIRPGSSDSCADRPIPQHVGHS